MGALFVLVLAVVLLSQSVQMDVNLAARGRPAAPLQEPSKNTTDVNDLTLENSDKLDSGVLFSYRKDMFYSVSDWLLILSLHRADSYLDHLHALQAKLVYTLEHIDPSKFVNATLIQEEYESMLLQISLIKKDLSIFQQSVAADNSTVALEDPVPRPNQALPCRSCRASNARECDSRSPIGLPAGPASGRIPTNNHGETSCVHGGYPSCWEAPPRRKLS